jgi:hypothetical protein
MALFAQVAEHAVEACIVDSPPCVIKMKVFFQIFEKCRLVLLCAVLKARNDRLALFVGVF